MKKKISRNEMETLIRLSDVGDEKTQKLVARNVEYGGNAHLRLGKTSFATLTSETNASGRTEIFVEFA